MTDTLLLAIAVLYLSACFARLPGQAWIFQQRFGKWTARPAQKNNAGPRFCFLGLFPWTVSFASMPWNFGIAGSRISPITFEQPYRKRQQIPSSVPAEIRAPFLWHESFIETGGLRLERYALSDGQFLWLEQYAAAGFPEQMRKKEQKSRLDAREAGRMIRVFFQRTRWLRWQSILLSAHCFVALPVAVLTNSLYALLPWVLIPLLLFPGVLFTFYRAFRLLLPERTDALRQTAALLLSPLAAMRAADIISIPYLARFHPVCLLAALQPADASEHLSVCLRDLTFPAADPAPEFRKEWLHLVHSFLEKMDMNPSALLIDARTGAHSDAERTFCPRCAARYVISDGVCADCEMPLIPFTKTSA